MLILHSKSNNDNNHVNSVVAVFGIGLIGVHLVNALEKKSYKIIHTLPFSWQSHYYRKKEKGDIRHCIRSLVRPNHDNDDNHFHFRSRLYALPSQAGINPAPTNRVDFVWSAGKGGFGMKEDEIQPELAAFSDVLHLASKVAADHPSYMVRFHMLSSAGGLFEGQRNVGRYDRPFARRPYAEMKLKQEQLLGTCGDIIHIIYRPTSVYGFAGLNRRMGLIPTLLWNCSKNGVSSIFGTPDTLRDYVWANDVGTFITDRIASSTAESATHILASGKPCSIVEIHRHIEKVLNKKLFCQYIKDGKNTEHNTFSKKTFPAGWNPINVETGIRKTFHSMFSNLMFAN